MKLISVVFFLIFYSMTICSYGDQFYKVSVNGIKLGKCERVESFDLKFIGGYICSFPNIPEDWTIHINNWDISIQEKGWTGSAYGEIHVGADCVSIDFLKKFLIFDVTESTKLKVKLKIGIMNAGDGRTITLGLKDLTLIPLTKKEAAYLNHPEWDWSKNCK